MAEASYSIMQYDNDRTQWIVIVYVARPKPAQSVERTIFTRILNPGYKPCGAHGFTAHLNELARLKGEAKRSLQKYGTAIFILKLP